jgi:hypothetical protein
MSRQDVDRLIENVRDDLKRERERLIWRLVDGKLDVGSFLCETKRLEDRVRVLEETIPEVLRLLEERDRWDWEVDYELATNLLKRLR